MLHNQVIRRNDIKWTRWCHKTTSGCCQHTVKRSDDKSKSERAKKQSPTPVWPVWAHYALMAHVTDGKGGPLASNDSWPAGTNNLRLNDQLLASCKKEEKIKKKETREGSTLSSLIKQIERLYRSAVFFILTSWSCICSERWTGGRWLANQNHGQTILAIEPINIDHVHSIFITNSLQYSLPSLLYLETMASRT